MTNVIDTRQGQARVCLPGETVPAQRTVTIFSAPEAPEIYGYIYAASPEQPSETTWCVDIEDGEGCEVFDTFDLALSYGVEKCAKRLDHFARVRSAETWPYSPSQVNTYEDCPRMWGWQYLEAFRPPSKESAAWGTEAHRQAEEWFRYAKPPDLSTAQGRAVQKALPHLPAPGGHLLVEQNFRFEEDGLTFRGQIDLCYLSVEGPYIIDHKTTGDFAWSLDENTLRYDTQAVIYAKAALDEFCVDELTLHWNYMLRTSSKPRIKQVKIKVTRAEVEAAFDEVKEKVREIEEVRTSGKRAIELPIVPTSCGKYGGCPHQDRCGLTAVDRMKAIMSQEGKKMNLKEKMKARQAAKAAAQGGAPVTPPAPAAAAPAAAAPAAAAPAAAAPAAAAPVINPPETAPGASRGSARQGRAAATATATPHDGGTEADREAFVGIYREAIRSGDPRAMSMADTAWEKYKQHFG